MVNTLKEENPDFFDAEMKDYVKEYAKKAYEAEKKINHWIFQGKDLDFLSMAEVDEYVKFRLNTGLNEIGVDSIFEVNEELLSASDFFENSLYSPAHQDFFDSRSVGYSKKAQSISEDDLF